MKLDFHILYLKKKFPLRISRGTFAGGENLFVSVTQDGITGWGEMAPGSTPEVGTAELARSLLEDFVASGGLVESISDTWDNAHGGGLDPSVLAALDVALWDLRAKQADLPLYAMLGLARRAVVSSLTVGINQPDVVRERVPYLLAQGARALKIKLGTPDGIDADMEMFAAVHEAAAGSGAILRVDANGGWSLAQARKIMVWLAARDVEYVEQPLVMGAEDQLPELYRDRALPVFLDESCRMSTDIPGWAGSVDGVNLKLMKCGGITEALRIVATARAFGLKTMIGCMGESSISIAAGASLGALFDYIDLDSHLNLDPDPATGAPFADGITLPEDRPGHGGRLKDA